MVTLFLGEEGEERSLKLNQYLGILKLWMPKVNTIFLQLCFLETAISTADL